VKGGKGKMTEKKSTDKAYTPATFRAGGTTGAVKGGPEKKGKEKGGVAKNARSLFDQKTTPMGRQSAVRGTKTGRKGGAFLRKQHFKERRGEEEKKEREATKGGCG